MKQTNEKRIRGLAAAAITIVLVSGLIILPKVDAAKKEEVQQTYYGAIAYSGSTGRFGSSWNVLSQQDANTLAMNSCNRNDCRVLMELDNSCGALARARNGAYVWSGGSSLYEAKLLASNRCTAEHGSCKLIVSLCSKGNEP